MIETLWNQLGALLFIKGFPTVLRAWQEAFWFQFDKQTKHTNKQPSFVDRWCLLSQVQTSNSSRKKGSMKIQKKTLTLHINDAPYFNFKTNNSNKKISNEILEKWNIEFTLTDDEHSSQCGNQINLLKKAFCFLYWEISQTIVHTWYIWKTLNEYGCIKVVL